MNPAIHIVPFQLRHLERVLWIERASFGKDAWPRALFREYFEECRDLFLLAKLGRRIAGYMIACVNHPNAEIASIAVHPDFRRHGVANALISHTLRMLKTTGARRVELMVRTGNEAGVQLYRSFAFRRIRRVPRYYEDGGDGILMTRALQ